MISRIRNYPPKTFPILRFVTSLLITNQDGGNVIVSFERFCLIEFAPFFTKQKTPFVGLIKKTANALRVLKPELSATEKTQVHFQPSLFTVTSGQWRRCAGLISPHSYVFFLVANLISCCRAPFSEVNVPGWPVCLIFVCVVEKRGVIQYKLTGRPKVKHLRFKQVYNFLVTDNFFWAKSEGKL